MKKIIVPLLVIVVFVFAVFYRINVLQGQDKNNLRGIEQIQQQEGYPVKVTTIRKGSFTIWRDLQGKVEGYRQAFISTPDAARVASIKYKVGDRVKADTPIISLDENDPKNISNVKLLESVYENAFQEYERYKNLYESGGVSEDVLDKMYLKLKTAKTNLDSARTTVHLTSPFDGILLALYIREGENAEPNKTLAIVSSTKTVRIVTAVSDRDVREFKEGQHVLIHYNSVGPLEGSVDRVALGANPESGLFDLELKVNNKEGLLKVGMFVTATVRIYNQDDALFIESQTILRDFEGHDYVWIVDKGNAKKKIVNVLRSNDDYSMIDGLTEGTVIVRQGKSQLREGVNLRILNGETI